MLTGCLNFAAWQAACHTYRVYKCIIIIIIIIIIIELMCVYIMYISTYIVSYLWAQYVLHTRSTGMYVGVCEGGSSLMR